MDYLLFSGPADAGKNTSIKYYKDLLVTTYGYIEKLETVNDVNAVILENASSGKRILIHPDSDMVTMINDLHRQVANHTVDAVIIGCRAEKDSMRDYMFKKLDLKNTANYYFEVPLGRMIRGTVRTEARKWYNESILKIAELVGKQAPFSF